MLPLEPGPPPVQKKNSSRLAFLDWARGAAALVMLQGHVTHAFMRDDLRPDAPYVFSQFIGGLTPAIFLFLTGITLAFMMDSRQKAGLGAAQVIRHAIKRAGYLMLLAVAFRLQMWLFAFGFSPWETMFKVDILNCMAVTVVLLAPLAIFDTRDRIRFGFISGLLIAGVAPVMSLIGFSGLHPFLRHYIVPNPEFFSIFPWGAYVAFGLSAGSILRVAREHDYLKIMQWSAMAGLVLIVGARYFANLPYSLYPNEDFWLHSPALVLIKLGCLYLLVPFAFLWTRYVNPDRWSFVRQLGTTSLLVYWVHTELVYGAWFFYWKNSFTATQCLWMAFGVIGVMVLLSVARTGWKGRPGFPELIRERWRGTRTATAAS
jgi:uncharacterized membrane protein